MAAIAVWMTYFIDRRQRRALGADRGHRPAGPRTGREDPKQIAIVTLDTLWMDENRWEIHLPDGRYRLCLATGGIGEEGLVSTFESQSLAPGRHRLILEQRRAKGLCRVVARCDGADLITEEKPAGWDSGSSTTTGDDYSVSGQVPPEKPVILLRRRFMHDDSKVGSSTPGGRRPALDRADERVTCEPLIDDPAPDEHFE